MGCREVAACGGNGTSVGMGGTAFIPPIENHSTVNPQAKPTPVVEGRQVIHTPGVSSTAVHRPPPATLPTQRVRVRAAKTGPQLPGPCLAARTLIDRNIDHGVRGFYFTDLMKTINSAPSSEQTAANGKSAW